MNNNVVYRLARGLAAAGGAALRFNFRGVGSSTGAHGGGVDEKEDALAALEYMGARHPGLPAWIAGFSFGARVGLEVGMADPRVVRLLGIGLAISMFDLSFLLSCDKPMAVIQAEFDEYGPKAEIQSFVDRMPGPKRLEIVDGATHLYPGKLREVEVAISRSIEFLKR